MPCFHPLDAWQRAPGARPTFAEHFGKHIKLPCGRCIGCKLERSKQWAVRLMNEAQQHEANSFITLTYNNELRAAAAQSSAAATPSPVPELTPWPQQHEHLGRAKIQSGYIVASSSDAAELSKRDLQLFIKRLRKHFAKRNGYGKGKLKYYAVGEYGEKLGRPHYHAAIYGEYFEDRYYWRTSDSGHQVYRSPTLETLWPYGYSEIGDLTFESAAYIARYITKKITGKPAEEHYRKTDDAGNDYWIQPEFSTMSLRPAIANEWIHQYLTDVYPHDYVVMRGQKLKPPRYYDKLLNTIDPEKMRNIKAAREAQAATRASDATPARLRTREICALAQLEQKNRSMERS